LPFHITDNHAYSQTSGGLLIIIPGAHADALLAKLKEENSLSRAEIIGEVTGASEHITIL